ncbi:MAG: hypothetical protein JNK51_13825 [Blastocatellia bacterium]|nr:hypothetical protein [Chloracidobacterium sp.]MBL8185993.1 hypothetical protein [Blastocatellia bacterium]HRJ87764.1 hypothetical protein [Pyrinomonadaceae bacterium]HRK50220.1 hypothetical protein [Pyrinomonadaceae bacterium]
MRTPEEKLLNPRPGSKIAEARDFGIDLTLIVGKLRKTPQQRIDDLQSAMRFHVELDKAREARLLKK